MFEHWDLLPSSDYRGELRAHMESEKGWRVRKDWIAEQSKEWEPSEDWDSSSPLPKDWETTLIVSELLLLFYLNEVYMYSGKNAIWIEHWACTKNERWKDTVGHRGVLVICSCIYSTLLRSYWLWQSMPESEMDPDVENLWFRASEHIDNSNTMCD